MKIQSSKEEQMNEIKYKIIGENKDGKIRQLYWNIAIGLQDVDNIKPSQYMLGLVKKNIEGKKTYDDVEKDVNTYYHYCNEESINYDEKEADLVSLRIVKLLDDPTFRFDINTYRMYYEYLFKNIHIDISKKYSSDFRKYNIIKNEPILNGDTVQYTNYSMIERTLQYDFDEERNIDYTKMTIEQIIKRISVFTSHIWQVHAFQEGNTRTTALFIQKYLINMGFKNINNDIFKDNSKYFRNALVRANYTNIPLKIREDNQYIEKFFSNLLAHTNYDLNNDELYIK